METDCFETVERAHGRVETRRYRTLTDLSGVSRHPLWKAMNMIGMVESTRELNGKCSMETRSFIGRIGPDAQTFAGAVRQHWGIENKLHWGLDVSFREDDCRVRETRARENLAVLRHIAITRLKQDPAKLGIQTKRLKAGWSESDLAELLFQAPEPNIENSKVISVVPQRAMFEPAGSRNEPPPGAH
jgi:predicted transposase YbfD/YdcC